MTENPIMTELQMFDVREIPSSDTDWTQIAHEYGNTQLDILIEHFGHDKRSDRFRSMTGQEFLT